MARILFLYSEMMPYMEAVIESLVKDFGDTVCVVSWDKKKLTAHEPALPPAVTAYKRSSFDNQGLKQLIADFKPQIVYASGRMDKGYINAAKGIKKEVKVVMGMDTQWLRTPKQFIQILLSFFLYKSYFTHIWVPGPRQFTFAQLLGYGPSNILKHLYSGDVKLFETISRAASGIKRIVFLGRLEKSKGLDLLLQAWQLLEEKQKIGWELLLIGNGSLGKAAVEVPQVKLAGFLAQKDMLRLLQQDCVFCLPSRVEPWGVVVHEMAAAGMPLILSQAVGAGDTFLLHGYNGYLLPVTSVAAIQTALKKTMSLTVEERKILGARSRVLAQSITPQIAAASLRSVLS